MDFPHWVCVTHEAYCNKPDQLESEENRLMASLGHPLAEAYRNARGHYAQLAYAAAKDFRFYSVADCDNFGLVSAPQLIIAQEMKGRSVDQIARAHAAAGWPHAAIYKLNCGGWHIKTTNEKLAEIFQQSTPGQVMEMPGHYLLTLTFTQPDFFERVTRLLDEHQYHFYETLRGQARGAGAMAAAEEMLGRIGQLPGGLPDAWL